MTRGVHLGVVAGAALFFSLVVTGATDPPTLFAKYLIAAQHPEQVAGRAMDFSPLYLAFVKGALGLGAPAIVLFLQCLMHAGASVAVAWTASELASPRWGLAAGLVAASYRPLLVYAGTLEPEIPLVTCLLVATALGLAARRSGSLVPAALSAGLLSLAALFRPQHVLLLPVFVLWVALGQKPRWKPILAAMVGTFAVVSLPSLATRLRTADGPPPLMNPGPVFYEGNGPGRTGMLVKSPDVAVALQRLHPKEPDYAHVVYRRIAAFALARPVGPAEANRYWTSLAFAELSARPFLAFRRFVTKLLLALSPYEATDESSAELLSRRVRGILPWGFGALLVGLPAVALSKGRADLLGPLAVAGLAVFVQVAFYASARQRLPLAAALLILAPVAVSRLFGPDVDRKRSAVILAVGVVLSFSLGVFGAPFAAHHQQQLSRFLKEPPASSGQRLADVLDGRSFARHVADASALQESAEKLMRSGKTREALDALSAPYALVDFAPLDGRTHYLQAQCLLTLGDRDGARRAARVASETFPGEPSLEALAALLSTQEPSGLAHWQPAGLDPVSARWAMAGEVALVAGPEGRQAILEPLREAFPELLGGAAGP